MDNAKTGSLITARRKELGLTQKELAEKLHISDRTVSKWERGAGFPDVSLLEPLADTLGFSVLDLIEGERQETAVTEVTVRSVISAIGHHVRKTTRQQIVTWIAEGFLLVMSAFILLAIADSTGLLSQKVSLEYPIGIYENGALTEDTIVTIDGERHRLTGDFSGRFAIAAIEETCRDNVYASIRWDSPADGYITLTYGQSGQFWIDGPLSRASIYMSGNMESFAVRLEDGRVLSSVHQWVPLVTLENYYPLTY